MSKYIIELNEDCKIVQQMCVTEHGNAYTDGCYSCDLEELNSDYINENFGELQEEAYQRGFEDGKKSVSEPDRIEVGDEVIWKTENITLIVTSTYETSGFDWCDGVAQDGKVYHTLMENDRKTGKHYDIASILEAMRT